MNFMVFEGYLGSGKTLGATIFAKTFVEKSGCALYSNCGVAGSKSFASLDDFKLIAQEESSILILDEAHIDLDSRSFNSNHVKYLTSVSYFLRKMRCTLIITSPSFDDLDSRIRGVTNILAQVTKTKNYFLYTLFDVQSNKYLTTYRVNKDLAFSISATLYDTGAMVTPIEIPKTKDDFNKFLEELKTISENYYIGGGRERISVTDHQEKQLVF